MHSFVFLLLRIMFLRFRHVVMYISDSDSYLLNGIPLHVSTTGLLRYSLADGHLGCFWFWPTMNKATMNIHAHVLCGLTFLFFWLYGILGSYGLFTCLTMRKELCVINVKEDVKSRCWQGWFLMGYLFQASFLGL